MREFQPATIETEKDDASIGSASTVDVPPSASASEYAIGSVTSEIKTDIESQSRAEQITAPATSKRAEEYALEDETEDENATGFEQINNVVSRRASRRASKRAEEYALDDESVENATGLDQINALASRRVSRRASKRAEEYALEDESVENATGRRASRRASERAEEYALDDELKPHEGEEQFGTRTIGGVYERAAIADPDSGVAGFSATTGDNRQRATRPSLVGAIPVGGSDFQTETIPRSSVNVNGNLDDGLVRANEVRPPGDIQTAAEVDLAEGERKAKKKRNQICTFIFGGIIVLCAIVLVLVLQLAGDAQTPPNTAEPSASPSESPTQVFDYVLSLLPEATVASIARAGSHQAQAFEWLVDDPSLPTFSDTRIIQRFALATFYFATGGDDWGDKKDWLSYNVHECDWYSGRFKEYGDTNYGVWPDYKLTTYNEPNLSCEGPGESNSRVFTHLWLWGNLMKGEIPPEIYLIKSIKSILLDVNPGLQGTISSEVAALSSLRLLGLTYTGLSGTIPTQIGLLSDTLQHINFSFNTLAGTIPSQLGALTESVIFIASYNQLSGTIPTQVGLWPKLLWLYLEFNALTGPLPIEMIHPSIYNIAIAYNSLTGPLPSQIGRIKLLGEGLHLGIPFPTGMFWLAGNRFSGTIPSEIGNMAESFFLSMGDNSLTGTIPTELGQLSGIYGFVDLGFNNLSGTIPTELGCLNEAHFFYLNDNLLLSGHIPSQLGQAAEMQILELRGNQLSGSIPSELGVLSHIMVVNLTSNELSGSIPTELTTPSLSALSITGNGISGTIPQQMCELPMSSNISCPTRFLMDIGGAEIYYECGVWFDCSDILCGCDCPCDEATNGTALNTTTAGP